MQNYGVNLKKEVQAFRWSNGHLEVLDQRLLPWKEQYISCHSPQDVAKTIKDMAVRGAPAIGCVAAYGMAIAARHGASTALGKAARVLIQARPTAVNLSWAVNRMLKFKEKQKTNHKNIFHALLEEAHKITAEDIAANKETGENGAKLLKRNAVVLTICNTGALATAGHGTALGIIRTSYQKGKIKKVFVCETRPYLQGARLTAWELSREKIPFELITDNMAGHIMKTEKVDAVIAGADRIAANGDTANKVGTYTLAVLANFHNIPFYIAAPSSTLDKNTGNGNSIIIEERSSQEVIYFAGKPITKSNTPVRHPAFDVTPGKLISAIITESGIHLPPYSF